LLDDGLTDSRWDMTYLTMQILIEGLALAAFQRIRDQSKNPLAAAVNAYVMQDEARHVAFGRLALRDFYPQLSEAERKEREDSSSPRAGTCATGLISGRFGNSLACRSRNACGSSINPSQ
jgi:hypothetical protein